MEKKKLISRKYYKLSKLIVFKGLTPDPQLN